MKNLARGVPSASGGLKRACESKGHVTEGNQLTFYCPRGSAETVLGSVLSEDPLQINTCQERFRARRLVPARIRSTPPATMARQCST
eukprot:765800-Hanusia_phi.AAC.1